MSTNISMPIYSPPPPPAAESFHGIISNKFDPIVIAAFTASTTLGLVLSHLIIITRYRLWHTNPILEKIPDLINNPISHALATGAALIAVVPYNNDLYIVWLVVLSIIYDNLQTVANYSLLEQGSDRLTREYAFIYNTIIIGVVLIIKSLDPKMPFFRPLIVLWSLLFLKFLGRVVNYQAADRAYGIKNTNIVANYMKAHPNMEGYPYLVMGEENKGCVVIESPSYKTKFDKLEDFITVKKVKEQLPDDRPITDVCVAFALFKLIRRRFFGFHAIKSQTKDFLFCELLPDNSHEREKDAERLFRVIKMELGFLRDFFYTRYPVVFAYGLPVFNIAILVVMCATSIWLSKSAFYITKHNSNGMRYWMVKDKNIDYGITNALLIVIIGTEISEVLSYVFSDWMKVIIICSRVGNTWVATKMPFFYKMLGFLVKPKFSVSLKNTIGQYSLLTSYNKGGFKRNSNHFVYYATCGMATDKSHRGAMQDKAIDLPVQVKVAIYDTLQKSKAHFFDSMAELRSIRGFEWSVCYDNPLCTIMIWHIATSMCEIYPLKDGPITKVDNCCTSCLPSCLANCFPKEKLNPQKTHQLIASRLSKYCAYLVVFAPKLLTTDVFSSYGIFDKIIEETLLYFTETDGPFNQKKEINGPNEQYDKMMKSKMGDDRVFGMGGTAERCFTDRQTQGNNENGNRIIDLGAKLGRHLMNKDDDDRWKVLADFWTEVILYLAPLGEERHHLEKLASGGEFITHLWAFLYHAGKDNRDSKDSHGTQDSDSSMA